MLFRLLSPSAHKILRRKLSRSSMSPVFQRLHGIFFQSEMKLRARWGARAFMTAFLFSPPSLTF
jgi:hypothetical protein